MSSEPFSLKGLAALLRSRDATEEPTQGHHRGNAGADPSEPDLLGDVGITQWARAAGRCVEAGEFAESLDGRQVEDELSGIFRETPEFGRSLALRLADFHRRDPCGQLALIGGGGEAVVLGDAKNQRVMKLLGGAGKAGFGWTVDVDSAGLWHLRAGRLAESLIRFALAEEHFPTGLEVHGIGADGGFLLLRQPFLVGENPTAGQLTEWMRACGWEPHVPPTRLDMLATLTWRRGEFIATDVRPENAILCEADGQIRAFDIIVSRRKTHSPSGK